MHNRNPFSSSPLRVCDVTPQRRIVIFDRQTGAQDDFIVLDRPRVRPPREGWGNDNALRVRVRSVADGRVQWRSLSDMGIMPYPRGYWNVRYFTVDHRKRHLLPDADPSLRGPAGMRYPLSLVEDRGRHASRSRFPVTD